MDSEVVFATGRLRSRRPSIRPPNAASPILSATAPQMLRPQRPAGIAPTDHECMGVIRDRRDRRQHDRASQDRGVIKLNAVGPNNANRALLARARVQAERLVFPALVAIYTRLGGSDGATFQSGTGFLVNLDQGVPVLVTARHTLYGGRFDEDPWTKHIIFDGRLRGLFELRADKIFHHLHDDLAAVYVDEIGIAGSIPANCLEPTKVPGPAVSIYGFLSRDFRRKLPIGLLRPQPYLYSNLRADARSRGASASSIPPRTEASIHEPE